MSIDWRVVPIESWPAGELTEDRKRHPFRKTVQGRYGSHQRHGVDWTATMELLERELRMLEAESVVLQMAVTDYHIRNDGWIRANASPEHPGVVLTFESVHGPLSYPCDQFTDWQANVRAIAISLRELRKIDRYGVTKTGEQYTGFKQLPPAGGSTVTMTAQGAAELLKREAGSAPVAKAGAKTILADCGVAEAVHREARKRTHPDTGNGSKERFQVVETAWAVLSSHHGRTGDG